MDKAFGPYRLRRQERLVEGPDGPVDLSARAFDLLCVLMDHSGEVVSKEAILAAVWQGVVVEENTLQVHVSALRKALDPNMIATVHGRGYRYVGPSPVAAAAPSLSPARRNHDRKPVIAVLPFANQSGDPGQQYYSDGMTEDIIDRLSRYRILSVIAVHSSFAMRGREADLAAIRDRLAVDYVVTGNVRKSAARIRIAARLTDAQTGNTVWAEHYDRPLEDVFTVQDEVAALVASALMGRVEAEAAMRSPADGRDVTSYEHVLKGIWHYRKLTVEDNERAAEQFRAALAINPSNAEALRWLSSYHMISWFMFHDREQLQKSVELGRRAAEIDPASALCHTAHAFALLWAEGRDAAAPIYRKALQANPYDPNVLAEIAVVEIYGGNLPEALALLDQAEMLNPLQPSLYAEFRAIAAFTEGRYADALPAFAAIPECAFNAAYTTACLGYLGGGEQLAMVMERVRSAGWDLLAVAADEPHADGAVRERLAEGISRAYALSKH
jgi:TolB-like protein